MLFLKADLSKPASPQCQKHLTELGLDPKGDLGHAYKERQPLGGRESHGVRRLAGPSAPRPRPTRGRSVTCSPSLPAGTDLSFVGRVELGVPE